MIVGHSMVAFAVVAGAGASRGWAPRRALVAGATAAAFAVVPDVDMAYGAVAVTLVEGATPLAALDAFWSATSRIHRFATHFLGTGLVAAVGSGAVAAGLADGRDGAGAARMVVGVAVLCGLVWAMLAAFGPLVALVVALYAATALAVTAVAVRHAGLDPPAVTAAAAFGLLSHPFGDMLTGQPPSMFYPLAPGFPAESVPLGPDPTLAFLAVFAVELATVWAALAVYRRLTGRPTRRDVDARALLGAPYAVAALVAVPHPLVTYYPTFSLLGIAGLGVLTVPAAGLHRSVPVVGRLQGPGSGHGRDRWHLRDATTVLVAVTLAVATYGACYLVVGA